MKCIIIHGFNAQGKELMEKGKPLQNERDWIPWLRESLEEKGIEVYTPSMPRFWKPSYEEWKEKLEEFSIDEETVLVGHSLGAGFLLRYLSENPTKIKKLVLVAPSIISKEGFPVIKKFYDFEINPKISEKTEEITIFTSNNDYQRMIESAKIIKENLGGKLIELKNRGHFIEKHMGTKEFPEILSEILE